MLTSTTRFLGALCMAFALAGVAPAEERPDAPTLSNAPQLPRTLLQEAGSALHTLSTSGKHLWVEFGWLLIPLIAIVLIKVVLLREPMTEVVACGLSIVAFLLLHGVTVVRFVAHELRRLALQLRNKSKSETRP